MKKGCVVALIIVGILAIVGIIGCFFLAKKGMDFATAGLCYGLEEVVAQYKAENPDKLPAENTNEAWSDVLKDLNMEGQRIGDMMIGGKLIDPYRNPLKFQADADGTIRIYSAGKDGQFDTGDDVSSDKIKELQEKFGAPTE